VRQACLAGSGVWAARDRTRSDEIVARGKRTSVNGECRRASNGESKGGNCGNCECQDLDASSVSTRLTKGRHAPRLELGEKGKSLLCLFPRIHTRAKVDIALKIESGVRQGSKQNLTVESYILGLLFVGSAGCMFCFQVASADSPSCVRLWRPVGFYFTNIQ
jgi:hypothetical protein